MIIKEVLRFEYSVKENGVCSVKKKKIVIFHVEIITAVAKCRLKTANKNNCIKI